MWHINLTEGMLLACVSVLSISRCERNMLRSPFSMYSVTMHNGSEDTHTHRSRMMLGSFRRDMILISFRKSFLTCEGKDDIIEFSSRERENWYSARFIVHHTWPGWWHQPSAASQPPEPNIHLSQEGATPHPGILGDLRPHTGGPAEVKSLLSITWCFLLHPQMIKLTSPNCPSPSFSLKIRCCRGNSAAEMSFLVRESTVRAGTAYMLLPVTPCSLTMSVSA